MSCRGFNIISHQPEQNFNRTDSSLLTRYPHLVKRELPIKGRHCLSQKTFFGYFIIIVFTKFGVTHNKLIITEGKGIHQYFQKRIRKTHIHSKMLLNIQTHIRISTQCFNRHQIGRRLAIIV